MKLLPFFLFLALSAGAQVPYKVVFDVTTSDTAVHRSITRWLGEIVKAHPDAEIAVVYYGKSLDMVTQGKSNVADKVVEYAARPNVAFKVCEAALRNNKVDRSRLINGVGTVPDGIYEIIKLQAAGFGYIKATR
jgi:intracellular sulfur oxidation DsrE/DsrF family protein